MKINMVVDRISISVQVGKNSHEKINDFINI